ncbi:MAG: hypothetical protein QNJ72_31195 [Pleurocapsa sp. MO_226.B13]|nr:hypothetical protein [Pleurocapsa sp. MO_226.B13]
MITSIDSLTTHNLKFSSDNSFVAAGSELGRAYIWRVSDGKLLHSFDSKLNSSAIANLAFSHNKSMIAAANYKGNVYVWRISDGELLHSFDLKINPRVPRISYLLFTQDEQNIITLASGLLEVQNIASKTNRVLSSSVVSLALSPDRETLVLSNRNNKTIDIYRFNDLSLVKQLDVNQIPITPKVSPDGKKIAFIGYSSKSLSGSISDRQVYLHSLDDGSLLNVFYHSTIFPKSKESLENFAISPDGRYLAVFYSRSATSDFFVGAPRWSDARYYGRIRVWRISDGKQLQTFRGHKRRTSKLVFSPDSKYLASTGGDGKVRFWKMPPRNYSWLWLLIGGGLAALIYWRRNNLVDWINH